ncbi:flagellin [Oleisolibacter albus]|uniref:flagellin N-terminal helical domain-containing protein n=1 Tax=Oleisolibacter albus TaxID=2171757 RepID=UPI000DF22571|nr:flagellin [Oleisolibacter albus]
MTSIATMPTYLRMLRDTNQIRSQYDDLFRQLDTGKKSETLSGLGLDAGRSVGLRDMQARLNTYQKNIDLVQTRTSVADTTMNRINSIVDSVVSDLTLADGTLVQDPSVIKQNARNALDQIKGLLNTQVEGRYIFAGSDLDTPPVGDFDQVLLTYDSFFKQYQDAAAAPKTVQIDAGAPSGAYSITLNGVTFNSTAGAPPLDTVEGILTDLRGKILADARFSDFTISIDKPAGGNAENRMTITASSGTPATAVEIKGASTAVVGPALDVDQDGNSVDDVDDQLERFNGTVPPAGTYVKPRYVFTGDKDKDLATLNEAMERVVFDPDFAYKGVDQQVAGRPRLEVGNIYSSTLRYGTAPTTARVDDNLDVNYGVRADASYFRRIIQGLTAVATMDNAPIADASSPEGRAERDRYLAVVSSARDTLKQGQSDLNQAVSHLGSVRSQVDKLEEKHKSMIGVAKDGLEKAEDADAAEVSMKMKAADTQLQASYQAITTFNRLSILDFLT